MDNKNYVKDLKSGEMTSVVKNKDINRAIKGEAHIEIFEGDKKVLEAHTENLLNRQAIWSMMLKQFLRQNIDSVTGDGVNVENCMFGNMLLTKAVDSENETLPAPVGEVVGFSNLQHPVVSSDVREGQLLTNSNSFIAKKFNLAVEFGVDKANGTFNTIWLNAPYDHPSAYNGSIFVDYKQIASTDGDIGGALVSVKGLVYKVFQEKVDVYTIKRNAEGNFQFKYINSIALGKVLPSVEKVAYSVQYNMLGITSNNIIYFFDADTLTYLNKSLKIRAGEFAFIGDKIVTPSNPMPSIYLSVYNIADLNEDSMLDGTSYSTGSGGTSTQTNETGGGTDPENMRNQSAEYKNAYQYIAFFEKWGGTYGVDPYLLLAMACQESGGNHQATLPGGSMYNGAGVGIMQIEKPGNVTTSLTAYNYDTKTWDTMSISGSGSVSDVGDNIRAGAMEFASKVRAMSGNIKLTIQAYNYGSGGIGAVLNLYSNASGKSVADIKADPSDEGWMAYRQEIHDNPSAYFSWSYGTYGDPLYVEHVLRYYASPDNSTPYVVNDSSVAQSTDGSAKSDFVPGSGAIETGTKVDTETNCITFLTSNYDNTLLFIHSYMFLGSGTATGSDVVIVEDKDFLKIGQSSLADGSIKPVPLNLLDKNVFYEYKAIYKSYVAPGTQTKLSSDVTKTAGQAMRISYVFNITDY